jgi:hypothetical protein
MQLSHHGAVRVERRAAESKHLAIGRFDSVADATTLSANGSSWKFARQAARLCTSKQPPLAPHP